jgi:shikimate dehydrogenase
MTTPDRYAVFGDPISHSKSPKIQQLFAGQTGQALQYTAERVPAAQFSERADVFFAEGGKGLNCTIPLKELAWQYAGHKTQRAQLSGAVNTLAWQADGSILGDNTDGVGLITDMMDNHGMTLKDRNILILGAGGASRGIIEPILGQSPRQLIIANRTVDKAINLAEIFSPVGEVAACGYESLLGQQFDLIINATSTSLSGQLPPLPKNLLTKGGYCYDLAYSNQPTAFVLWGLANGASKSLDGLGMLVEQAAQAFYIWRKIRPTTQAVITLMNAQRGQ